MDEGTKREQRVMDSVLVCMRDVYAMRDCMCRQVGAMRKCDVCYMMRYAMRAVQVWCAMLDGQAGRSADAMVRYANMLDGQGMCYAAGEACKTGKNGAKKAENRGIVDILYDGFRKCFVNCKFTFYITLSSYLKKVKIPKTRKNHSKM